MAITLDGTNGITTETGTGDVSVGDDLIFTGTGNRITGDFSNATLANRVAFQTSTTNGPTSVSLLPNGTSQITNFRAFNTPDPTNSAFQSIAALSTEGRVELGITGTGTYLPMTFYTGGSQRMRIDTSGNLLFDSGYGSVATAYGCRAWVNFDGTTNTGGNCTIRASGNVSTVADGGVGTYTVNFTTSMPDDDYATVFTVGGGGRYAPTTTSLAVGSVALKIVQSSTGSDIDTDTGQLAIFR